MKLAPENPAYRHHQTSEDNGDAHLKNLLLHHQVVLPITDGKIDFGPWQRLLSTKSFLRLLLDFW